MKKIFILLTMLAVPWWLSAQSLTIANGTTVSIGVGVDMTVPGTITNSNTTPGAGLIIKADATGSGSLISAAGTNPTATVKVYVKQDRWNMVSIPVQSTTGQTFSDASNNDSWLTKFDEATGANDPNGTHAGAGWIYITKLDSTLTNSSGFSYWPSVNETVSFKGYLQTGDKSVTLSFTDANHGYNLIGNPYSSPLHWGSGWSFTNVEETIWIWDGSQYQTYTYNLNPLDIPIGQGFFMHSTGGTTITLPAGQRVHITQSFFKSSEKAAGTQFNHLTMIAQNNQYQDKAFIYFDKAGTEGFDNGYDATKMFGLADAPQIYLVENNLKLTNDFLPLLTGDEKRTVVMGYIPGAAGEQKIIADFSNYHSNTEVTLEDLKTGDIQNLNEHNVYTFTGTKEDSPERFLIHFGSLANGRDENIGNASSNIKIYSYGKDVYIRSNDDAINQSGKVFIYDLMGHKLVQQNIANGKLIKLNVNTNNNYVVVRVVKAEFTKIKKVFIK